MHDVGEIVTSSIPGEPVIKEDRSEDKSQAIYEYIAFQINREDGLINYRLTWALQLNGFLFAALALIVGTGVDERFRHLLVHAVPMAGLATNVASFLGVIAANIAIHDLKVLWRKSQWEYPRPFGGKSAFWLGLLPSVFLPLVLGVVWGVMLYRLWA